MVTKNQIDNFLAKKNFAIIGVSRNPKKFGNAVYSELRAKNYNVYIVNPNLDRYESSVCYPDLMSLPEKPEALIVSVNKSKSLGIVKDAHSSGINDIWLLQMSETKEAVDYCEQNNINVIYKQCIMMFLEPVESIHKFHRFFKKIFGRLPK